MRLPPFPISALVLCIQSLHVSGWLRSNRPLVSFGAPLAPADLPWGSSCTLVGYLRARPRSVCARGGAAYMAVKLRSPNIEEDCRYNDGIEILHEDDAMVVVNKPAGVPVFPSPSASGMSVKPKSVTERLLTHYVSLGSSGNIPQTFRSLHEEVESATSSVEDRTVPGPSPVVHRLDEGTSGVLLLAKTAAAGTALKEQFRERKVKKVYIAITHQGVRGPLTVTSGIGRAPHDRRKMQSTRQISGVSAASAVRATGKVRGAVTFFKPLLFNGKWGVVLASPVTGRTHQIRLHLQMIKTPILGDILYGNTAANSRFLAFMRTRRDLQRSDRLRVAQVEGSLRRSRDDGAPSESFLLRPLLHAARVCCVHPTTRGALTVSARLPKDMREALSAVDPSWPSVPELMPFAGAPLVEAVEAGALQVLPVACNRSELRIDNQSMS